MFIANVLVIIGALNWLCIGLFQTDYVTKFVGEHSKWIFIIVGLSGIYLAYNKVLWFIAGNNTVEHMITSSAPAQQCVTGTPGCTPMY